MNFFVIWQTFLSKVVETSDKILVERDKAEKLAKREAAAAARTPALKSPAAGAAKEGEGGDPATRARGRGRGRGA